MNFIVPHMRVNAWIDFWSRKKKFLLVFYSHILKASLSFIHPLAPKHFTHFYFCACTFTITLPLISLSNFPPLLSFLHVTIRFPTLLYPTLLSLTVCTRSRTQRKTKTPRHYSPRETVCTFKLLSLLVIIFFTINFVCFTDLLLS